MSELIRPLTDASFDTKTVAYTGTAGSTGLWPAGPEAVWVFATTAAYIAVGEGVTATATNGVPVPANIPVRIEVPRGSGSPWRASALQIASGGSIYCKPINTTR